MPGVERVLVAAVVGFLAQLVDGALGMAYGVTATTLLLSTGATAAVASATVHLAEIGTTLASGTAHWRHGNVDWRLVAKLGVPGAVGAAAGATVLSGLDADWLRPAISVLLLGLGLLVLVRFAFGVSRRAAPPRRLRTRAVAPLGLGAGFLDAVGGGGWGPVTTPTLLTAARLDPRRTIGSVSAAEFLVAAAASIGFLVSLGTQGVDLRMAAGLLVGGVAAAPVAAWAVRHVNTHVMGTAVGGLIGVTNARILLLAVDAADAVRLAVLAALAVGAVALVVRTGRREGWRHHVVEDAESVEGLAHLAEDGLIADAGLVVDAGPAADHDLDGDLPAPSAASGPLAPLPLAGESA